MRSDLRSTLHRLAPSPKRNLDVSFLVREGRRRQRTRYLAYAALSVAVVTSAAVIVPALLQNTPDGPPIPPTQPDGVDGSESPTGRIVFVRDSQIWVMNADGTAIEQLTTAQPGNNEPAWDRTGTQVVFVSHRDGNPEIYVMNADGSDQQRLTRSSEVGPEAGDSTPAWSPDGTRIAFVTYREGQGDIYVMNADGTGQVPLTTSEFLENAPAWSPDGTEIAFARPGPDFDLDIFVVGRDGGEVTRLTTSADHESLPSWSPDGSKIALLRYRNGRTPASIFVMDRGGGSPREIVTDVSHEYGPAWSPDGRYIAFVREGDIYIIGVDGAGLTRLTTGGVSEGELDWTAPSQTNGSSFACPELIAPGPRARQEMRPAVDAYLDARQPEGTDGYNYRIKRLRGRSELGFPEGDCPVQTWRRSFRVEGSFEYEEGATNQSASLAYFRIVVGRTEKEWVVWAEPH